MHQVLSQPKLNVLDSLTLTKGTLELVGKTKATEVAKLEASKIIFNGAEPAEATLSLATLVLL